MLNWIKNLFSTPLPEPEEVIEIDIQVLLHNFTAPIQFITGGQVGAYLFEDKMYIIVRYAAKPYFDGNYIFPIEIAPEDISVEVLENHRLG